MKALTIIITFVLGMSAGVMGYACLISGKLSDDRTRFTYLTRIIDRMRRTCNGCRKFPDAEINKISS